TRLWPSPVTAPGVSSTATRSRSRSRREPHSGARRTTRSSYRPSGRWSLCPGEPTRYTPTVHSPVSAVRRRAKFATSRERVIGVEPTTLCLASTRSSQLSYTRKSKERLYRLACRGSTRGPRSCRRAAILSSLKRPAILSSFSAMKGMELMAEWQWKRWDAVARLGGEAHAAGGGACARSFGPAGAPHSTGGRARGPGGAAAWQRRAGAGEQAPGGGAAPDPAAAADEVSRLQRRALHGEARRGAAPAPGRGADGAPRAARGRRAGRASAAATEAAAASRPQGAGRADAPVGRKLPRLAGGPRAVAVPHRGDR